MTAETGKGQEQGLHPGLSGTSVQGATVSLPQARLRARTHCQEATIQVGSSDPSGSPAHFLEGS